MNDWVRVSGLGLAMLLCAGTGFATQVHCSAGMLSPRPDSIPADYGITSSHWDPILQQSWVVMTDCSHPERPTIAVLAKASRATEQRHNQDSAVIHGGDRVLMWSSDVNVSVKISGVAQESGAMGDRIHIIRRSEDGSIRTFLGVVRGPNSVEFGQ